MHYALACVPIPCHDAVPMTPMHRRNSAQTAVWHAATDAPVQDMHMTSEHSQESYWTTITHVHAREVRGACSGQVSARRWPSAGG
jgi:hypothetical protein